MTHKTRGIIFSVTPYNDSVSIAHVYTELFGPVAYFIPKAKGKSKKNNSSSIFHHLALLDLEVEHKNLREIHRIKESKANPPLLSLLSNPVKSTISLFLAEFLLRVVREAQPNEPLFNFLTQSIRLLDLSESNYANFHLVFITKVSRFLGFYPDTSDYQQGAYFDMRNAQFVRYKPSHPHFLNPDESTDFARILRMNYQNMHLFRFSREERRAVIDRTLEFYRIHLNNFPDLKSLDILHEVFG